MCIYFLFFFIGDNNGLSWQKLNIYNIKCSLNVWPFARSNNSNKPKLLRETSNRTVRRLDCEQWKIVANIFVVSLLRAQSYGKLQGNHFRTAHSGIEILPHKTLIVIFLITIQFDSVCFWNEFFRKQHKPFRPNKPPFTGTKERRKKTKRLLSYVDVHCTDASYYSFIVFIPFLSVQKITMRFPNTV